MRTDLTLSALAATLALMAAEPAWAQDANPGNPPRNSDAFVLLLVLNSEGNVGEAVGARLERYIQSAARGGIAGRGARPPGVVVVERIPPTDILLDGDQDSKAIDKLIQSRGAEVALVGNVAYGEGVAATRATLLAPTLDHGDPERQEHWTVRSGRDTLELPLAYGTFRFDSVSLSDARVAPTAQQRVAGGVVGTATRLIGLNNIPALKRFYWQEATTTEEGVASFVAGIAAYRGGDYVRAERLFMRAKDIATPSSRTRAEAAVLELASAARAVPAVAEAQGKETIWPWSRRLKNVERLGKAVRKEFPWSVETRKVLATFYLEVAATAPDSVFKGGPITRPWAVGEARDYVDSVEQLSDGADKWTTRAKALIATLSR